MADRQSKTNLAVLLAGVASLLLLPVWSFVIEPRLETIPKDFSYSADVVSYDDFFDPAKDVYSGEQRSSTKFSYETVSVDGDVQKIRNVFAVSAVNRMPTVTIVRTYAVDRRTGKNLPGGDHDRTGYVFAPRGLRRGESFTYWHVNYDAPAVMRYVGEEEVLGLHVHHYETRYEGVDVDQSKNLTSLDGVGVTRGVKLEPYLQVWVEPMTGRLIKYEDRTEAYFYDLTSGARLTPWNRFRNTFTLSSVDEQVKAAKAERRMLLVMRWGLPATMVTVFGICLLTFLPRRRSKGSLLTVTASYGLLLVGLVATCLGWLIVDGVVRAQARFQFESEIDELQQETLARLAVYGEFLRAGRGLFASVGSVDQKTWEEFVDELQFTKNYPGAIALAYAPVVRGEDLAKHVAAVRASGFEGYSIRPEGARDTYVPVLYSAPFSDRSKRALGYDMFSDDVRREVIVRAKNTGDIAMTGKVTLITDQADPQSGFLMFLPVFGDAAGASPVKTAHPEPIGYIYAPFRMEDFMGAVLIQRKYGIDFDVYDTADQASGLNAHNVMFSFRHDGFADSVTDPPPRMEKVQTFVAFGRPFTYRFRADESYGADSPGRSAPTITAVLGAVISLFVFLFVLGLSRSRIRAMRIAEAMTEDLSKEKVRLEEAKAKDDAVLESIADGVVVIDTGGSVVSINGAATSMLHIEPEDVIGGKFFDLVDLTDERGVSVRISDRPLSEALVNEKAVSRRDLFYVRRDSTTFPVALSAAPVVTDHGIIGAVEVFRDITDERAIDKAKSEFVSLASHQLRTPLTAISWYVQMLQAGDAGALNKEQAYMLNQVGTANKRMIDLVFSLLNVSRIDLGKLAIEPEPTSLGELVTSVLEDLQPSVREKGLVIEKKLSAKVPVLSIDPKLVRIIVQNLLSNAVKYSSKGGRVTVTMELRGESVRIKVADEGLGIPPEEQSKVFGKLFRASNARIKVPDGNGLGLYVTKSIVERLGGRIWFVSKENKGTAFSFELPLAGVQAKEGIRLLDEKA